jgi:hypothetical protein
MTPQQRRTRTRASGAPAAETAPSESIQVPEDTTSNAMTLTSFPADVFDEIKRQVEKWSDSNRACDDDRWLEIAIDEFNDLRWACRTRAEVDGHTIAKERAQLIAVLIRWHLAGIL